MLSGSSCKTTSSGTSCYIVYQVSHTRNTSTHFATYRQVPAAVILRARVELCTHRVSQRSPQLHLRALDFEICADPELAVISCVSLARHLYM